MDHDLDADPGSALALCRSAHQRLADGVRDVGDDVARSPSRLPGWSVGHVLTHLARNADGHAHRLEGALAGVNRPRYPGGDEQRNGDIERGAGRPADELVADVLASQSRLEEVWERCEDAGWPLAGASSTDWPTPASPVRRLREVEFHHVDLGLGYSTAEWSDEYVAWELARVLDGLPRRLASGAQARDLILWLTRDGSAPERLDLDSW